MGPASPGSAELRLIAPRASESLGRRVASLLGTDLSACEVRFFADGELRVEVDPELAGADAYILHSLNGTVDQSVHDRLFELVLLLGAAHDVGVTRLTVVMPYLCYSRHDRRFAEGGTVGTRDLAKVLESTGVDRVATVDVHNPAVFQNAFRCRTVHLESTDVLARHLAVGACRPITVLAPDAGAIQRAAAMCSALERLVGDQVQQVTLGKRRVDHVVEDDPEVHGVEGTDVVIIDDMLASGATAERAARACRSDRAASVTVAVTHGLMVGGSGSVLAAAVDRVVVTDSVQPLPTLPGGPPLEIVDLAPLLGEAIAAMAGWVSLPVTLQRTRG